jgi:hypothetical protein
MPGEGRRGERRRQARPEVTRLDGAELRGVAGGGDAGRTGGAHQAQPAHVLQQSRLVDENSVAVGEDQAAAGHPTGEALDGHGDVGVDLPAEALGGLAGGGDGDDPVARGLADLGDSAEAFTLPRTGLGGEHSEVATCELVDGGLLLGREGHPCAGDGVADRLLGRSLRRRGLALGGGDDLLLGLDDDAGRPVVAGKVLQLGRLLDAAEQPVKLAAGKAALCGFGDRGAKRPAVNGGVLAVEEGRTLRWVRSVMTAASAARRSIVGRAAT